MRKYLLIQTILWSFAVVTAVAQTNTNQTDYNAQLDEPVTSQEVILDEDDAKNYNIYISGDENAESEPISIDQKQWNKLTDDKAFDYNRDLPQANNSFLHRLLLKIISALGTTIGKVIIWGLGILILAAIVWFVLKRLKLTNRADKSIAVETDITANFTTATDWNSAIQEALKQNNYPLAVAYMFRHLVFQLHEKDILKITDTATNSKLLRDLRPQPYYKDFRTITTQYEYVCFGEYPISTNEMEHYQQQYRKILQQI